MNDSIYEEYMRNVLGYQPINCNDTYDMDYDRFYRQNLTAMNTIQMQELENCYPDIYRIINPMIQRACSQNTRPVTRELVESMTDEIYFAVEDNVMEESRGKEEKLLKDSIQKEARNEDRQRIVRNRTLNDLIRILLLRELLGRPGFPSGRPPRPRPPCSPMRPPLGPRPGMGQFDRNAYDQFDTNSGIYEY